MNILFCGCVPFPHGLGASVHMLTLARGMAINGHDVQVISPWPTEPYKNSVNTEISGIADGVPFCYVCGRTDYPIRGKLLPYYKFWMYFYGLFRLAIYMSHYPGKQKPNLVFAHGEYYFLIPLHFFCRHFNIPLIHIKGEFPFCGRKVTGIKRLSAWIDHHIGYRFADGMLVATQTLQEYYMQLARPDCRFFQLPLLIDMVAFDAVPAQTGKDEFITYCGHMGYNKDGVEILIQAFAWISLKFPAIKLKLIGTASLSELKKLKQLTGELNIADRVIFTGQLPHHEVLSHLKNSKVLALARPDNKQAQGGFPSKVGEYLLTGRPVVITAVGEIPQYLTDGVNAFLAIPDSVESFAEKLTQALSNEQQAAELGKQGRELAITHFDSRNICKSLLDFFLIPQN